jgi:hypothetical protein
MSALLCIGEPISWLRLEAFALGAQSTVVEDHVAKCNACRHCLDEIRGDLTRCHSSSPRSQRGGGAWTVPALAFAGAALILLALWRRGGPGEPGLAENQALIKGTNDVLTLGIVRERAGTIRKDVLSFAPGDPVQGRRDLPAARERGSTSASSKKARPLPTIRRRGAPIACGNEVVVPGAFTLTGGRPEPGCVRVASGAAPPRSMFARDNGVACVTVRPE